MYITPICHFFTLIFGMLCGIVAVYGAHALWRGIKSL